MPGPPSTGNLRVVAPASPIADTAERRGRIQRSLDRLSQRGITPYLVPEVWLKEGYLAGPDEVRARSLAEAIESDADVVWAARGGYGCTRLLAALDEALPARPRDRVLLGFSDLSALFPLMLRKGLRCVHGPVLAQAGSLVGGGSAGFDGLVRCLSGSALRKLSFKTRDEVPDGALTGPLWGGNLTLCAALCGTPYAPDYDGAILFVEDVGEPAYRLDRLITQIELAGVFEAVRGVLVGDLGARGRELRRVNERWAGVRSRFGIPVVSGLPIGHSRRNACLEVGVPVELRFQRGKGPELNAVSMTWID